MPAFDMGWGFRLSALYVSDPAFQAPVLLEAYPHTYTNDNGDSITAGWVGTITGYADRLDTNDPRIAGINYAPNDGTAPMFQVDLSSGSAPGTGDYAVDLALGDPAGARLADFRILDTDTVLIDGTNGGAGLAIDAGHFRDATLADVTASTTWTGTPVVKTFATTMARLAIAVDNIGGYCTLAHFRLTKQEGGGPAMPTRRLSVRGA